MSFFNLKLLSRSHLCYMVPEVEAEKVLKEKGKKKQLIHIWLHIATLPCQSLRNYYYITAERVYKHCRHNYSWTKNKTKFPSVILHVIAI